jgi:hypothetical protein
MRMLQRLRAVAPLVLGAAALLAASWGCTRDAGLTAPEYPGFSASAAERNAVEPQLLDALLGDSLWKTVTSVLVLPGQIRTVSGSRYSVSFGLLSLASPILFTIQERDKGVLDVQFGPDGTQFLSPVTARFNYANSANDPVSANYCGCPPKVFYYNPGTDKWELVPGKDDPQNKVYTVQLQHFSRYAMTDGTGGWESVPPKPGESTHGNVSER